MKPTQNNSILKKSENAYIPFLIALFVLFTVLPKASLPLYPDLKQPFVLTKKKKKISLFLSRLKVFSETSNQKCPS